MNDQPRTRRLWLVLTLAGALLTSAGGQSAAIGLDEALRTARVNYDGLERE